jgi:hypothetical protein
MPPQWSVLSRGRCERQSLVSNYRRLSRIYGVLAPALQELVARDIDGLVDELLHHAVEQWRLTGWHRFDDLEINCTIQLYKCLSEVGRSRLALRILTLQLEWVQPTAEMMAGNESASGMKRPDLNISLGLTAARLVECKRLALTGGLPKRYVDEGMARFVSGKYAESGIMVGYVQADTPPEVVDAINTEVDGHWDMGSTHRLAHLSAASHTGLQRYQSNHIRSSLPPTTLQHYLVDMR